MTENKTETSSTADEARTEKRVWQTPAIEVFDVATATLAGGGGPNPVDFATYLT